MLDFRCPPSQRSPTNNRTVLFEVVFTKWVQVSSFTTDSVEFYSLATVGQRAALHAGTTVAPAPYSTFDGRPGYSHYTRKFVVTVTVPEGWAGKVEMGINDGAALDGLNRPSASSSTYNSVLVGACATQTRSAGLARRCSFRRARSVPLLCLTGCLPIFVRWSSCADVNRPTAAVELAPGSVSPTTQAFALRVRFSKAVVNGAACVAAGLDWSASTGSALEWAQQYATISTSRAFAFAVMSLCVLPLWVGSCRAWCAAASAVVVVCACAACRLYCPRLRARAVVSPLRVQ